MKSCNKELYFQPLCLFELGVENNFLALLFDLGQETPLGTSEGVFFCEIKLKMLSIFANHFQSCK